MKTLDAVIEKLSPELQREVEDFAVFLLEARAPRRSGKIRMGWTGSLSEFREQFTSLTPAVILQANPPLSQVNGV
jgi:Protein of unknown function (DUF2281)